MAVNLGVLLDMLKNLLGAEININSPKQESSISNQNSNNNNVNINGNGNTVNGGIIININGNNTNVNIMVINEPADIKKVWPSIEKDLPIKFGSFDNLWLCAGKSKDGKVYVNIGKYYSCTANGKTIVFWLGAEAMENEACVKLYINKDQLDNLELKRETLCEEGPKAGVFQPRMDEFSSDASQEVLKTALNKKLKTFLENIFNDR